MSSVAGRQRRYRERHHRTEIILRLSVFFVGMVSHSIGARRFVTPGFLSTSWKRRSVLLGQQRRQQQRVWFGVKSTSSNDDGTSGALILNIRTPEDMEDLGALLSVGTSRGDVLLMDGDLGAGKTCFARGFVRARTSDDDLPVTSPTYLLCNTYPASDMSHTGDDGGTEGGHAGSSDIQ